MRSGFKVIALWLLASFAFLAWEDQTSFAAPAPSTQSTGNDSGDHSGRSHPTPQEIAGAKAKSLVWVNTATRVYHKGTSPRYGTTEHGKFMTEQDANKAGYRIAADESRSQRTQRSTTSNKQ